MRARPLAPLLALLLFACAGPAEKLRVNLVGIEPVDVQLLEQRFDVKLRVQNPNDTRYSVSGVDLVLEVNGRELGSAVSNDAFELPGYSETLVELTLTSGLFRLLRQVDALSKRGEDALVYRLRGHLRVDGVIGRLGFDTEGEFKLDGIGADRLAADST